MKGSELKSETKVQSIAITKREDKGQMSKPTYFNDNVLAVLIRERGEREAR